MEKQSAQLQAKAQQDAQASAAAQKEASQLRLVLDSRDDVEGSLEELEASSSEIQENLNVLKKNITFRQNSLKEMASLAKSGDCYKFNEAKVGIYEVQDANDAGTYLNAVLKNTQSVLDQLDDNLESYKNNYRQHLSVYEKDKELPSETDLGVRVDKVKTEISEQTENIKKGLKEFSESDLSIVSQGEAMECVTSSP